MRWRDVLIGAIVTLLVTVVGGVVVYYVTRQPPQRQLTERLVYQADTQANFTSEKTKLSFHQVRVGNIGDEAAHNVLVGIEYVKGTSIVDSSVVFSSGPAAGIYSIIKSEPSKLVLSIATVAPREQVSVAMIVDGESEIQPHIAVKSERAVGVNAPIVQEVPATPNELATMNTIMKVLMPLALLLQIPLALKLKGLLGGVRSVNNVAFMYVHKGLCAEAKTILEHEIGTRGATSYELVNYGLCLGLEGGEEKAEKHFKAAEFYSPGSRIKGLAELYRAILAQRRGDVEVAHSHLRAAMKASPKQIKKYAEFSDIVEEMFKKDQDSKKIVENG